MSLDMVNDKVVHVVDRVLGTRDVAIDVANFEG